MWVKISRDNKERTFTFARGYKGQYQAHDVETYSFKWVANWSEATDKAQKMIATYA
jgi:hypothetical protein